MSTFTLDPVLKKDTFYINDLDLCTLRLMDDSRYQWVIMVPQRKNLTEIIDLSPKDRETLMQEITFVSEHLKTNFNAHKLNVAALGNVVRQLHIHVIVRQKNDPAWPAPIWGKGEIEPYKTADQNQIISTLKNTLKKE